MIPRAARPPELLRLVRGLSPVQRGAVIVIAVVMVWGFSEIAVGLYLKATASRLTPPSSTSVLPV